MFCSGISEWPGAQMHVFSTPVHDVVENENTVEFEALKTKFLVPCTTAVRTLGGVFTCPTDKAATYEDMRTTLRLKNEDFMVRSNHADSVVVLALKAKDDQRKWGPATDVEFYRITLPNRSGRLEP